MFINAAFFSRAPIPIQLSRYSILSNRSLFSAGVLCFCALPPLVKTSLRAHLLVTVVVFILYLGRNYALLWGGILNRVFESTNYTHENTGAGHNF